MDMKDVETLVTAVEEGFRDNQEAIRELQEYAGAYRELCASCFMESVQWLKSKTLSMGKYWTEWDLGYGNLPFGGRDGKLGGQRLVSEDVLYQVTQSRLEDLDEAGLREWIRSFARAYAANSPTPKEDWEGEPWKMALSYAWKVLAAAAIQKNILVKGGRPNGDIAGWEVLSVRLGAPDLSRHGGGGTVYIRVKRTPKAKGPTPESGAFASEGVFSLSLTPRDAERLKKGTYVPGLNGLDDWNVTFGLRELLPGGSFGDYDWTQGGIEILGKVKQMMEEKLIGR